MKQRTHSTFLDGIRDSIPIAIIYFIVSFTLGVTIARFALPVWYAALFSAINYTSVGEATGLKMIVEAATLWEIGIAVFIVNLRYILTGISLSQRLEPMSRVKRMIIGIFITDEMYALVAHNSKITFKYYIGLSIIPYVSWTLGTAVGALADAFLPPRLQAAMGIALFCMFIGLVIPPAKRDKRLFFTIGVAAFISCLLYFTPWLKDHISFGIRLVISAIIAAAISALIFPVAGVDMDLLYTRDELQNEGSNQTDLQNGSPQNAEEKDDKGVQSWT
ncbi:MAG: AzlC family ABC transporter permease [Clostridia bacterium]|nr:AzlC family ABC transporter permease [Clostridia bacterium]